MWIVFPILTCGLAAILVCAPVRGFVFRIWHGQIIVPPTDKYLNDKPETKFQVQKSKSLEVKSKKQRWILDLGLSLFNESDFQNRILVSYEHEFNVYQVLGLSLLTANLVYN